MPAEGINLFSNSCCTEKKSVWFSRSCCVIKQLFPNFSDVKINKSTNVLQKGLYNSGTKINDRLRFVR